MDGRGSSAPGWVRGLAVMLAGGDNRLLAIRRGRGWGGGLRRLLVILLGTVLVAVPTAAGERASQLDAPAASLALAPTAGPPTSKAAASGSGFAPGERVDLLFDGAA